MATGKKAVKKSPSVKTVKKTAPVASKTTKTSKVESLPRFSRLKIPKARRNLIITAIVVVVVLALFLLRNQLIAATVNNEPIWRFTLDQELEKESGKRTLDYLISKTLILQEAKKQNITVTGNELDSELKDLEQNLKQQGQTLDELLASQGMTKDQLNEQMRLQLIIKKILGKNIKVTDKEISDYIDKNKDFLPQNTDEKTIKENVKKTLEQDKLNQAANKWITDLRSKAKIKYYLNLP